MQVMAMACQGIAFPKTTNAPKRPASSYMLWLKENRQKIIDEHFADYEFKGREKVSLVGQKAGELWKGMSEEDDKTSIEDHDNKE